MDVVINGPFKNALGTDVIRDLREQLRLAAGEPILLRGSGDSFSAGLNLREVLELDVPKAAAFLGILEQLVVDLFDYPSPVVAYMNGHAIAGGAVLALACDHRVVAANPALRVGLNEVALGVTYPPRVMALVRNRMAPSCITEVVLGAALCEPEPAVALGLADEVAADAEAVARERLAALARHPRDGYRAAKRALRAGALDVAASERGRFEREELPVWTSSALHERIRGVLRK